MASLTLLVKSPWHVFSLHYVPRRTSLILCRFHKDRCRACLSPLCQTLWDRSPCSLLSRSEVALGRLSLQREWLHIHVFA